MRTPSRWPSSIASAPRSTCLLTSAHLWAALTAVALDAVAAQPSPPVPTSCEDSGETPVRSPARCLWAMLLARIYEAFPLTCPPCGAEMRIVAFISEAVDIQAKEIRPLPATFPAASSLPQDP